MRNYHDLFGLISICVGAVVGAGFASGQEINQFFVQFGWMGLAGIGVSSLILIVWTRFIMVAAYRRRFTEYRQACRVLLGPQLASWGDFVAGTYLFAGLAVMIAGGGEALSSTLHLSTALSSLLFALLVVAGISRGVEGLVRINKVLVPLLVIVVFLVLVAQLIPGDQAEQTLASTLPSIPAVIRVSELTLLPNWLVAATLYAAFNFGTIVTVFSALGDHIPDSHTAQKAGLLAGVIMGLLLVTFWFGIFRTPGAGEAPIPMAHIASMGPRCTQITYLVLLLLAMYTSAIADVFALTSRFRMISRYPSVSSLLVTLFAWVVAQGGFVPLINTVYPAYGYMWTAMLIIIVIRHRIAGWR